MNGRLCCETIAGMNGILRPVAIGYRRVSTNEQGKSGLGLEDQDGSIRAFCTSRGLSLLETFTEVESGKNDDRPELAKALERARRAKGMLVVCTLSRLGRRVSFVASLMDAGTPFACADAPDDEPFILHVKASFAEEEARKISQRTKAALAALKARGVTLGTPGNLTLEGRKRGAATIKARAATENRTLVLEVRALRERGLSIRAIADATGSTRSTVARLLSRAG